ncbi:hypothetical protein GGF41_001018 [Coemansia sp. RSA 2531]|nr:hypothetical protein GGF41_001018 [Coemansia sp. RSA 2531]
MTDLVDKLASMDAVHMSQYLKEVGWTGMDDHSVKIDATSSAQSIPGMSYMFLIKDPMLEAMAKAASSFTSNTASSTAQLKPAIQDYLQQTRDGFEYIPGYNALNTLASLTNNPAIAQLTQLIGLSYRYPTASYLELALLYYRSIGMPGLDNVINYPSQFIGNIASTVVGGFISNAISGLDRLNVPHSNAIRCSGCQHNETGIKRHGNKWNVRVTGCECFKLGLQLL